MQPWTIFGQLFSMVGGNASFGSCDINHTSNASIRAVFNTDGFLTVFFHVVFILSQKTYGLIFMWLSFSNGLNFMWFSVFLHNLTG